MKNEHFVKMWIVVETLRHACGDGEEGEMNGRLRMRHDRILRRMFQWDREEKDVETMEGNTTENTGCF